MTNNTIRLKIMQRLNKLASMDYDNIECWQIVEAFNKAQLNWCRRQLHGTNIPLQGDEQSKARIDDLQILLTDHSLTFNTKDLYQETQPLPGNYFAWKRIKAKAEKECCEGKRAMKIYLAEEANVDVLLSDTNKRPSFEWGETFCILKGNRVHVYTNNEFTITTGSLVYYRLPRMLEIKNCVDPYTSVLSPVDVTCEFKDDITEVLIDEAAKILAGDIESFNQQDTASNAVENNN